MKQFVNVVLQKYSIAVHQTVRRQSAETAVDVLDVFYHAFLEKFNENWIEEKHWKRSTVTTSEVTRISLSLSIIMHLSQNISDNKLIKLSICIFFSQEESYSDWEMF